VIETKEYVGLDIHKKTITAVVMDKEGNIKTRTKFRNTTEDIYSFMETLQPNTKVVMEACSVWEQIYDLFQEEGFNTILAHPLKLKAIASARIKNDSIDAKILADLLRTNLIPESYAPPRYVRDYREIARLRASLVKIRTILKNRIHAILHKNGIKHEFSDIFGRAGLEFLRNVDIYQVHRYQLDIYLNVLNIVNHYIEKVSKEIERIVISNPDIYLLTTIPGVSFYSALLIYAEIGDIQRFKDSKSLCSYAGLVPSLYQSGSKSYNGRITKEGSKWLRWILIQCANASIRQNNVLSNYYGRLKIMKGKHHNVAISAVARKMLEYIWIMLMYRKAWNDLKVNKNR